MILNIHDLCKHFGGLLAVDRLSFDLQKGETLGLIGPNGAGKTTVFNLVAGLIAPTKGRILFEGREITGSRPSVISRRGIGRTFQKLRPFSRLSTIENVMVGFLTRRRPFSASRTSAASLLERVGLQERADVMARGLSTGQLKRLELARALSTEPRLLLLDEFTGGVDQRSLPGLLGLILELKKEGRSILLIEHNMGVVHKLCDRVVALHLGKKIAEGPPADVTSNPEVVDAYLGNAEVI